MGKSPNVQVKTQESKTNEARIRIKTKKLKTASFEMAKAKFGLAEQVERGLEIKKRRQRKIHRLSKAKKSSNADRVWKLGPMPMADEIRRFEF